jgi:hypothetical protein
MSPRIYGDVHKPPVGKLLHRRSDRCMNSGGCGGYFECAASADFWVMGQQKADFRALGGLPEPDEPGER